MKIAVLTSGGDAPGMNAAIRAVVRAGISKGMEVYGVYHGYSGLIKNEIEHFSVSSVADIIQRGGTMLGTARSDEFRTKEGRAIAYEKMKELGIDALVVLGGDGTFKGGLDIAEESDIKVYGVPCTIDNDLGYTDNTIGFDTAVNTVLDAIGNIRDTSSAMGRTTVLEVMGRHCGDIALYAGLAGGAENILVPEEAYDLDKIAGAILKGVKRGKLHSIIIKAEGVEQPTDEIAKILEEKTGCETRTVNLGYVQRGGSPTARDRVLASRLGVLAVDLAEKGADSCVVGVRGEDLVTLPFKEALSMKKNIYTGFTDICNELL